MKQNVYSDLKIAFHPEKISALTAGKVTAPIYARIKPINACNQDCFYCCYHDETYGLSENFKRSDYIPFPKLAEIINDMGEMGVKAITFSGGGEPLLYPQIIEAAKLALDRGIKISLITNGQLLKNDAARIFSNASWVRLSLDSNNDILFAKIRNVSVGAFSNTIENIAQFARKKRPDCELGVNIVVNHLNYEHVYEMIEIMKKAGSDHAKVMGRLTRDFNLYHQPFFSTVREQIKRAQKELMNERFTVIDKYHEIKEISKKKFPVCYYMQCTTIIAADQNVYTCHDKAYSKKGVLGSLKNTSFKEFWFLPETREKFTAIRPSRDCNHHCVALNKNELLMQMKELNQDHIDFV